MDDESKALLDRVRAVVEERAALRDEVERARATVRQMGDMLIKSAGQTDEERLSGMIRVAEERGARWVVEAWHRDELGFGPAEEWAANICNEHRRARGAR